MERVGLRQVKTHDDHTMKQSYTGSAQLELPYATATDGGDFWTAPHVGVPTTLPGLRAKAKPRSGSRNDLLNAKFDLGWLP